MARTTTTLNDAGSAKWLTAGLLDSIDSLWASCAKRVSRATKKLASNSRIAARSRFARPKQLIAGIGDKAINFRSKKKVGKEFKGLWQRTILMGEKCQPLDFSGVIYYDSDGKRVEELPVRSPRASQVPSYSHPEVK